MSDGGRECYDCRGTGWKSPVDYPHPNAKIIDLICTRCHGSGLDPTPAVAVFITPDDFKALELDRKMMAYDRDTLVQVLVYHWPTATSGCGCGWAVLGASHPEHVADVYEASIAAMLSA